MSTEEEKVFHQVQLPAQYLETKTLKTESLGECCDDKLTSKEGNKGEERRLGPQSFWNLYPV